MSYKLQFWFLTFLAVITSAFGGVNFKDFGNCETNGTNFSYAPEWLHNKHCSLHTSNDYVRANWWPVTDVKPSCQTNEYVQAVGWTKHPVDNTREEIDWIPTLPPQTNEWGEIIYVPVTNIVHFTTWWIERNYVVLPIPPPPYVPRRIYKYDLSAACAEYDFLDQLIEFISADTKVKWFWDAAEILVENDPYFIAATNTVIQSGVPESKVKAIIERAYELGQITEVSK